MGKLMVNILAAIAQFERDLLSEGVTAGIANASLKGKRHGRKPFPKISLKKIIGVHLEDPSR